jgi:hypothetical protein
LWSVSRELEALACFFLLSVCWDWWWFVLNPHFGLKRFRRGEIWWHAKWIGNRVPVDYVFGIGLVIALCAVASYYDANALLRMAIIGGIFVIASLIIIVMAPVYQQWSVKMFIDYGGVVKEEWKQFISQEEVNELTGLQLIIQNARTRMAVIGIRRACVEQIK